MFKFLKDKIKGALSKISKSVEEEVPDEVIVAPKEEQPKQAAKPQKRKTAPKKEVAAEKQEAGEEQKNDAAERKKGFLSKFFKKKEIAHEGEEQRPAAEQGLFAKLKEKIVTKKISADTFDKLFWELELALLENNVAVEVAEKIKENLKKDLVDRPIKRGDVGKVLQQSLKDALRTLLTLETIDLVKAIKQKKEKPYVIVLVGVNGSGKTTTVAKLTYYLQQQKLSCALIAADTFRAGSKEQLREWADRLKVKLIAHDYGADPAAVCFDGVAYAKKQGLDVVLIDTAGRQHSNINLIKQMEKIVRVAKPDLKLFVGEAITGNDMLEQAKQFNNSISIDGVILTKADVDEKGGATISVSHVIGKPIFYMGVGQRLQDLEPFAAEKILAGLGL